jgi:hypothetical protein
MIWIVLRVLNETRPMYYYALSAFLFVLSQLAWFLLGKVICKVCILLVNLSIFPPPCTTCGLSATRAALFVHPWAVLSFFHRL